jgi:hypothetical protein
MHGGRRRLDTALAELYPLLPRTVTTIDSFALSLINRWRRALGAGRPFVFGDDPADDLFGIQLDFDEIAAKAIALMDSATVRSFIGTTYPLIMVDEFQDCHGKVLQFVQALAQCSSLALAADEFQLLDSAVVGCPAVSWVQELKRNGRATVVELVTCHRTSANDILGATRALRDRSTVTGPSVPVIVCPGAGPAAFRIVEKLAWSQPSARWGGTCGLLSPTRDRWIGEVLASCDKQLAKRGLRPLTWEMETTEGVDLQALLSELDVSDSVRLAEPWTDSPSSQAFLVQETVDAVRRVQRSRGLEYVSRATVAYIARRLVHGTRTYGHRSSKRIVSTIHGAKNREFDHVFVLWPYSVTADSEAKRRLLYNAISRARQTAMVLVRGDADRCRKDAALSLLGEPTAALPTTAKRQQRRP